MKHYLTFQDDVSDKFWQIETSENSFTVTYGRTGTAGQSQNKTFDSVEKCLKEAEKILSEKRKKGYVEDGVATVFVPKLKSEKEDNLQEVLAAYDKIIVSKQLNNLLPFLQGVDKHHYEPLRKHIRFAKKYWVNYVELEPRNPNKKDDWGKWGYRGDEIQKKIIVLSAIALFNKTEISSWSEAYPYFNLIEDTTVREILLWSKPTWIDSYLLDVSQKNFWQTVDYEKLRIMEDLDLVNYNPQLYAACMTTYQGWDSATSKAKNPAKFIEFICNDYLTIDRISVVFDYETNIQNCFGNDDVYKWRGVSLWEEIFNRLLKDNKINRQWFLENCLQTQTKEWNNGLRSYFRKRFEDLKPNKTELLALQQTLFPLLHASINHVPNFAVAQIKDIYDDKFFDIDNFFEWIQPVMMREDCKGSVKTVLSIFEKLCKNKSEYQSKILDLVVDVFAINDLTIQEKAAKLIQKYANKDNDELTEKLSMYAPQMLGNVQDLVKDFLIESIDNEGFSVEEVYAFKIKNFTKLNDKNIVEIPKDWNEFFFLIGEFVTSANVITEEILMNAFILLNKQIPADFQQQCSPYFKKLTNTYYASSYKNYTRDFVLHWMTNDATVFKQREQYYEDIKTISLQFKRLSYLDLKLKTNSTLPLLSFPTHKPYWIEPKVLIERLIEYQSVGEQIDMLDLSIAIARMPRERVEEALNLCERLDDNLANLMKFCLGETQEIKFEKEKSFLKKIFSSESTNDKTPIDISVWAVAARTFYPDKVFTEFENTSIADIPNVSIPFNPQPSFKEQWNEWKHYQTQVVERSKSWYVLTIDYPPKKNIPDTLLYSLDIFAKKQHYYNFSSDDVYYWYGLTPQNLNSLYLMILQSSASSADEGGRVWEGTLKIMLRPNTVFNDIALLMLALACFQQKRDIRGYAAEVLIHHFQDQTIDPNKLGEQLGFILFNKFAPLQRLIDIISLVKDVSTIHNQALLIMIDALVLKINSIEEIPNNTKKLMEIYFDLYNKTKMKPSLEIKTLMGVWQKNASLKSICKQISEI